MKFAVLGGDGRMAYLARRLSRDGNAVATYASSLTPELDRYMIGEAVSGADCVILPLPAEDGEYLFTPHFCRRVALGDVIASIEPGSLLLAGSAKKLVPLAAERGIELADYFQREELTVKNADITAEGAVQILMEESPRSVSGMRTLVVGFGRIGKLTAAKLAALGAEVTASARKASDLAWIEALGYRAALTERLDEAVRGMDAVINTVPAPVIGEEALAAMGKGCLIIDLASEAGCDPALAERAGVRAIRARSLPGRLSPESAADAICGTVYKIMAERGRWI